MNRVEGVLPIFEVVGEVKLLQDHRTRDDFRKVTEESSEVWVLMDP